MCDKCNGTGKLIDPGMEVRDDEGNPLVAQPALVACREVLRDVPNVDWFPPSLRTAMDDLNHYYGKVPRLLETILAIYDPTKRVVVIELNPNINIKSVYVDGHKAEHAGQADDAWDIVRHDTGGSSWGIFLEEYDL